MLLVDIMVKVYPVKVPEKSNVHDYLREFIATRGLKGGVIVGIGGLEYAEIGYLNPNTRQYIVREFRADETILEVISLLGNYLVKQDNSISIHIHVTLSTPGSIQGGHLVKGIVTPFLEVFLLEGAENITNIFTHR